MKYLARYYILLNDYLKDNYLKININFIFVKLTSSYISQKINFNLIFLLSIYNHLKLKVLTLHLK